MARGYRATLPAQLFPKTDGGRPPMSPRKKYKPPGGSPGIPASRRPSGARTRPNRRWGVGKLPGPRALAPVQEPEPAVGRQGRRFRRAGPVVGWGCPSGAGFFACESAPVRDPGWGEKQDAAPPGHPHPTPPARVVVSADAYPALAAQPPPAGAFPAQPARREPEATPHQPATAPVPEVSTAPERAATQQVRQAGWPPPWPQAASEHAIPYLSKRSAQRVLPPATSRSRSLREIETLGGGAGVALMEPREAAPQVVAAEEPGLSRECLAKRRTGERFKRRSRTKFVSEAPAERT
jgi:hypothetical protein